MEPITPDGDFWYNKETYSFQKVDGLLSLMKKDVIFESPVVAGDTVSIFTLAGDKSLLVKDPNGVKIKDINSVYILFDVEINIKEK